MGNVFGFARRHDRCHIWLRDGRRERQEPVLVSQLPSLESEDFSFERFLAE